MGGRTLRNSLSLATPMEDFVYSGQFFFSEIIIIVSFRCYKKLNPTQDVQNMFLRAAALQTRSEF